MKATCPSCGTTYNLTPKQVGPAGRTLQCAKCKHKWFVAPAAAATVLDEPPPLPPSALPGLDELASIGSGPSWLRRVQVAWGPELTLTLAGLITASVAVICFNWLLSYTPPDDLEASLESQMSADTPATHQPGPQPAGLTLSGLSREVAQRDGSTLLIIRGNITNTTLSTATLPDLRVQLLDTQGVELDYWPVSYTSNTLAPQQQTTWQVSFVNPPLARVAAYRAFFANGAHPAGAVGKSPSTSLDTPHDEE